MTEVIDIYHGSVNRIEQPVFGEGNPRYLVGLSGAEQADTAVESSGGTVLEANDGSVVCYSLLSIVSTFFSAIQH